MRRFGVISALIADEQTQTGGFPGVEADSAPLPAGLTISADSGPSRCLLERGRLTQRGRLRWRH